jgi:hypothetical protein
MKSTAFYTFFAVFAFLRALAFKMKGSESPVDRDLDYPDQPFVTNRYDRYRRRLSSSSSIC